MGEVKLSVGEVNSVWEKLTQCGRSKAFTAKMITNIVILTMLWLFQLQQSDFPH